MLSKIISIRYIAVFSMIASAGCWGSATVMSRDLLGLFEPITLLCVQLTASVFALILLSLLLENPFSNISWRLVRAGLIGILEPGLTYAIGLIGLSHTSAGSASVITNIHCYCRVDFT